MNEDQIKEFVQSNIKDSGLVIFIRTSPQCFYCELALDFLNKHSDLGGKSVDLTKTGDQKAIINYLGSLPGSAATFPRVFINEQLIGGYSDLRALEQEGPGVKAMLHKEGSPQSASAHGSTTTPKITIL